MMAVVLMLRWLTLFLFLGKYQKCTISMSMDKSSCLLLGQTSTYTVAYRELCIAGTLERMYIEGMPI